MFAFVNSIQNDINVETREVFSSDLEARKGFQQWSRQGEVLGSDGKGRV